MSDDIIVKKRENWIDYAKSIAMILVVFGHVASRNLVKDWIYSFHMPLFFFISGITLNVNHGGYREYVKKLCRKILLPYFLYSLMYWMFNAAKVIILHKDINLIHNLLGIIIQLRGTDFTVGVWFLPLLFLSEILVFPLLLQKKRVQIPSIMFLVVIGFIYAIQVHKVLPWGLDVVPFSAFFIWLGFQYKEFWLNSLKNLSVFVLIPICLALLCINVLAGLWNDNIIGDSVDMYSMTYGNPCLYYIAAFAGIGLVLIVCKDLLDGFEINPMKCIGQNTLHIYCIHGLVISVFRAVTERLFSTYEFSTVLEQCFVSFVVILICLILIYFGKRIKKYIRTNK